MARPKRSERPPTRGLVLQKAGELLHAHGYLGVSMDDVAEAAGVRKASLYHHFPGGKEQIILTLAMDIMADFGARLVEALRGQATVRDRLIAIVRWRLASPVGTERRVREAAGHMSPESQAQIWSALRAQLFVHIHRVFADGRERGELRQHDSNLVNSAFMAVISELDGMQREPFSEQQIQEIADLFLVGVAAP